MGVESGSQKILDAMDKGLNVSARRMLHERRLAERRYTRLLLPAVRLSGRDLGRDQQTIALVRSTRPTISACLSPILCPARSSIERVQAQLGSKTQLDRQRRPLCDMFASLQRRFLPRTPRCAACRGRLMACTSVTSEPLAANPYGSRVFETGASTQNTGTY